MTTDRPLAQKFWDYIAKIIDEEGVNPGQGMILAPNDELTMLALAVPPVQAYGVMLAQVAEVGAKEAIFGLDRFTKEGQGTKYGDVLAGHYFDGQTWHPFIIEYRHDPRVVEPLNWSNPWWYAALRAEMVAVLRSLAR